MSFNCIDLKEEHDFDSNRSPILITLSNKMIGNGNSSILVNRLTDWDYLREILNNKLQGVSIKTTEEITKLQQIFRKQDKNQHSKIK